MTAAIKPDEVFLDIPEAVLEVVNALIKKNWTGKEACIMQNELVHLVSQKLGLTEAAVFDKHYLDIEKTYRDAGWKVVYDKPGYCETYEASFRFTKG